jgi:2,6-dihydroxypyridine 3-monooxygenase
LLPETARYLVERAGVHLDGISIATSHIRYLDRQAERIYEAAHQYRFSSWNTVYRALLAQLDPALYHLGHEMSGWTDGRETIELRFGDRPSRTVHLLVCADGVASTARALRLPQVQAVYTGYVAWRGTIADAALDRAKLLAIDDAITYYVYANSHILVYPIPGLDGAVERGHRLINFVW